MVRVPEPESWARAELPALTPTKVDLDFPEHQRLDPFDITDPRTQLLIEARAFSYCWAADQELDFTALTRSVSRGYRSLNIVEKLAVIANGLLIREWPQTPDASWHYNKGAYHIHFKNIRRASPMGARVQEDLRAQTQWAAPKVMERLSLPAYNYSAALQLAVSFPPHVDEAIMVTRTLLSTDWH